MVFVLKLGYFFSRYFDIKISQTILLTLFFASLNILYVLCFQLAICSTLY